LKHKPKIVVITGAESTGKSELTKNLAHHFKVPYISEFARQYVENLGRKYNYSDVEKIACEQVKQMDNLKSQNYPFIFADTWLIITKVWFELVFNKTPDWIENKIKKTKIDLFLICDIDLPWIPDSVRENGGEKRIILQELYIKYLKKYNFNYEIISGLGKLRFENALKIVSKMQ
jgi:NadR type nicotinamide-nucleotide adenylyltransferase